MRERTRLIVEFALGRLQGMGRDSAVVKAIMRQFEVSDRQARRYVRLAWKCIQRERGQLQPFDVARMEHVFEQILLASLRGAKAVDPADPALDSKSRAAYAEAQARELAVAEKAADKLAKIRGVYAPERHAHAHLHASTGAARQQLDALTLEELEELERIYEKMAAAAAKPTGNAE